MARLLDGVELGADSNAISRRAAVDATRELPSSRGPALVWCSPRKEQALQRAIDGNASASSRATALGRDECFFACRRQRYRVPRGARLPSQVCFALDSWRRICGDARGGARSRRRRVLGAYGLLADDLASGM